MFRATLYLAAIAYETIVAITLATIAINIHQANICLVRFFINITIF